MRRRFRSLIVFFFLPTASYSLDVATAGLNLFPSTVERRPFETALRAKVGRQVFLLAQPPVRLDKWWRFNPACIFFLKTP